MNFNGIHFFVWYLYKTASEAMHSADSGALPPNSTPVAVGS